MKPKETLAPEQQERLRELYRKCSAGLLLLPPTILDDAPPTADQAASPSPTPHRHET